jgi:hypothetical protein
MLTTDARKAPYVPGFIECVTLRNILLVILTLAFLFNWWQIKHRKSIAQV